MSEKKPKRKFEENDEVKLSREVVFNVIIRKGSACPYAIDELDLDKTYRVWKCVPHNSRGKDSDQCKNCVQHGSCSYEVVVLRGNEHFCLCADFLEKVSS